MPRNDIAPNQEYLIAYQDTCSFYSPTRLVVDRGSRSQIPGLLARRQLSRPLIVTDRGLVDAAIVDLVTSHLDKAGGIPAMAEDAMKSVNIQLNPRKKTLGSVVALYEESF